VLPVNEMFPTIQGEGTYTGTPSWFVRLQGCPVGCGWCDTKHTWWLDDARQIPVLQMMGKTAEPSATHAWMDVASMLAAMSTQAQIRHVVITGGEPCLHDLHELTGAVLGHGMSVQVETSCTFEAQVERGTWITGSPKFDMPGGKAVLLSMLQRAHEIKYPVGKQTDIDRLCSDVVPHLDAARAPAVYLQPLSQSPGATRLCVDAAMSRGFRLSAQVHKYIHVR